MAQTIKLKRSATAGKIPTTSSLELGEVAINTYDGKMYMKKSVEGTETIVEVTSAQLPTDPTFNSMTLTGAPGPIEWNSDEDTVDVPLNSDVTLQLGQESVFRGKAVEAISNGDAVMFAGAQGDHLLIAKADASADGFSPEYVIGIATQDFALNEYGFVTTFGKVRGLNTSAYTEGTILYFDPNTAGGLTTTKPTSPDHIIQMCAVVRSHITQGTLLVRPTHMVDTDEVPEGSSNLYFTDQRVFDAADSRYVNTAGDRMLGNLRISSNSPQLRIDRLDGAGATWQAYSWTSGINIFPNSASAVYFGRDGATTDVSVYNGDLQIGTTTVIDSNRNLTNIQSISIYEGTSKKAELDITSGDNFKITATGGGGAGLLLWGAGSTIPTISPLKEGNSTNGEVNLGRTTERFNDAWFAGTVTASAFSGALDYNDITNPPTIPDGNLYVRKAGDTMTGNLTIQNNTPSLVLIDTESSSPTNQSIRIQHDAIDTNLPTGEGLGLRIDTTDTSGTNLNPCVITSGQLYAQNTQKVFHDAYHPNADKWTTARTNTVVLSGDVTGSGNASVDGTGNWTVAINTDLNISSTDTFTGTYPIAWLASDNLYKSTWLTINGATDTLNTRSIAANGTVTATSFSGNLDYNDITNPPVIDNSVDYINAASFNTGNGVLTLSGVGRAGATVDLDDRYMLQGLRTTTADYDTLTSNGLWRNQGGANGPEGGTHATGLVALESSGSYGFQLFSDTVSSNSDMYFRNKDTAWGSWNKLWHSNNLNPVTGLTHDTVNTELDVTFADGTTQSLDLTQYIDDTNLSRVVSGSHVGSGIVRFVREDATTFDVDFSDFFDDTNLARITSASWNTSNGVLSLIRNDATTVNVDLDNRYLQSYTETDTLQSVTARGNTTNRSMTITSGSPLEWARSGGNAHQRADARLDGSDQARLHWYGRSDSSATRNFKHAWYDGASYINVTASSGGRIDFTGAASSMYIGTDRVFDDGYHPNADKWTTARSHTVTLTGEVTGTATQSVDGTGNKTWTINTTVDNNALNDQYVQQLGTLSSPDYQTPSSARIDPNASNPTNEHYAVMTYGNGSNVTGQLATHFVNGATYNRAYNNSWSAWSRMYDDDYHPISWNEVSDKPTIPDGSLYVLKTGDTMTGTLNAEHINIKNDNGLWIRTDSTAPAQIRMSNRSDSAQYGWIQYKYQDGTISDEPVTSNDGFLIGGTEPNTVVRVEGHVDIDEDLNVNGNTVMDGKLTVGSGGLVLSNDYLVHSLSLPYFTNGVADLAVDISLGNTYINTVMEFEITGGYSNQNTTGLIRRKWYLGFNADNGIWETPKVIDETIEGAIASQIYISDPFWDSGASQYKIRVYHKVSTGNEYSAKISMLSINAADDLLSNVSVGNLITASTTSSHSTGLSTRSGYKVNGTTVVDSSRNLTNIQDVSIVGNGNEINFSGGNNRIKFSGYRALEGTTDGANLYLAEGYATVSSLGHINMIGKSVRQNGTNIIDNDGSLGVKNSANNTGKGLSLYGGASSGIPTYGVAFAGTGTFGNHGGVTGDWATYFTMSNSTNRGWIFKRGTTNVASIDGGGDANFNDITSRGKLYFNKDSQTGYHSVIDIDHVENNLWPFVFQSSTVGNDNESGFWVGNNGYPDMRLRRDSSTVRALISSWEESYVSNGFKVDGRFKASGGADIVSTASNPFRWQRSSLSQTGQDDNVTVHLDDSNIYFTHNNDSDGDASGYNFRYMSGGAAQNLLNFSAGSLTYKGQNVFHDGYHPNADKWTTARTNTVTLTGDVTGTGSASVDGSGNWTVSVPTVVANDSHTHDGRYVNVTGDTMTGALTIGTTNDAQLYLTSPDTWTGIGFNDSGTNNEFIWHYGTTGTFAIGGGGSTASGKKLHVHGAMTIGSSYAQTSVGTNGLLVQGDITTAGLLTATQKSFTIDHPTKEGYKLRYGSLEGPENGVYVRGRLKDGNVIELPEVWKGLVHEDSITVNLTPIGKSQDIWVEDFNNEEVIVGGENVNCFYTVYGERKDVDKLTTEFKEVE